MIIVSWVGNVNKGSRNLSFFHLNCELLMFCFLPLGKGGGIVQLPEYPLRGQQHATRMVSTI